MNKYELAVVLSAKLEDEERAAAMEKVTGYITRFGGTVTDVEEWGGESLGDEIEPHPHHGAGYQILMRKTGCVRVDKERVIV